MFGSIGFLMGVAMQAPLGGILFTDWRGPVASLAMTGFGAGTGAGVGRGEGQPFRRGISGSAIGLAAGVILGLAGAGILVSAVVALVLVFSLVRVRVE